MASNWGMAEAIPRWRAAQAASDQLWRVVRPEALYDRPVPERHRLIFYLGHLEAFDWNLLAPALEQAAFHPEWDQLFAFGIDPVDGQLPAEPAEAWPAVAAVRDYNREVRRRLQGGLERQASAELAQRLEVAIEHRWMHVETLSYLFHNLAYARKQPGPLPTAAGPASGRPLVGAGPSAPAARVPLVSRPAVTARGGMLAPTRGPRGPKSALRLAGAAPDSFPGGGPPCGITTTPEPEAGSGDPGSQPFAPILPAGKAARPPR
ncbi:MAG TPA: DinB family protein, partial [Terriglobales bacterium]|nr:DinB family protein [Terriglobales bacterium]